MKSPMVTCTLFFTSAVILWYFWSFFYLVLASDLQLDWNIQVLLFIKAISVEPKSTHPALVHGGSSWGRCPSLTLRSANPHPEGCGSLGIALHPPGGSDTAAAFVTDGLTLNERVTFNHIMLYVLFCRVLCRFILIVQSALSTSLDRGKFWLEGFRFDYEVQVIFLIPYLLILLLELLAFHTRNSYGYKRSI